MKSRDQSWIGRRRHAGRRRDAVGDGTSNNGETGRLQRTWIDEGVLTIPGAFTKNGRAHAIPLLPMAKTI